MIGQRHGLQAIAQRIQTARAQLDAPSKPIGVFLLAGPSGVGKTETALALAEALYGGEHKLITISMSEYPRGHQNQAYLLAALEYHFEENAQVSAAVAPTIGSAQTAALAAASASRTESGSVQRIVFTAHPTATAYRPEVRTPKPRTRGPQSAVVVGPPGEEIWTDQYGRVKVQFHWDRLGAMDEHSSCWVRVSTYALPARGMTPELTEHQQPICYADTATGEPGLSAPVYECDLCPPKPKVDVLLLGSAYAAEAKAADKVLVGLVVGQMQKAFVVTGPRRWSSGLFGHGVGPAEPFLRQAISYDIAFGGTQPSAHPDKDDEAFDANPVGRGFSSRGRPASNTLAPQTEQIDQPITHAHGTYKPMSFGPVGRHWQPRASHAGTYDQTWREQRHPFLPRDFDSRYFQAAPTDQQLPQLRGGEMVRLLNLTPPEDHSDGMLEFALPQIDLRVLLHGKAGVEAATPQVDTLLFEPDERRFSITWKVSRELGNDLHRYVRVEVGDRPKGLMVRIPLEMLAGELPSRQRMGRGEGLV